MLSSNKYIFLKYIFICIARALLFLVPYFIEDLFRIFRVFFIGSSIIHVHISKASNQYKYSEAGNRGTKLAVKTYNVGVGKL